MGHMVFSALVACAILASSVMAQESYTLAESFAAGTLTQVEQKTELTGQLMLERPAESKDAKPQLQTISLVGTGRVRYDERILTAEDTDTLKVIRQYRTFEFQRIVGDREQKAELRPVAMRQVVLRSTKGKSPFSPDGPLLWSEIDAVHTDIFSSALVPALLPNKAVTINDTWPMQADGITELTDMEKVQSGGFTLKLVAIVKLNGQPHARLSLTGSAKGIDDNGPCQHTLDGTAYFDLTAKRLTYLSIKGTHNLLNGTGQTLGTIQGRFTLTRSATTPVAELSDAALQKLELKPTLENSALLYDNTDLKVRFQYPRRWRIGAVQGRQVTLDGPRGAGILITVETAKSLPKANDYLRESQNFLEKSAKDATVVNPVERSGSSPMLDRFALTATIKDEKLRMEYAVLTSTDGTGVTFAARLPASDASELAGDLNLILKTLNKK